ncbi:hypothetical protein ACG04R_21290 [Roseateles sp. BYS78W]|uniref:Uncharacterized protein n=1 Tax=Pelomonas candidula TaxID=3299025 RepID=A0ABW7HIC5_9BURK
MHDGVGQALTLVRLDPGLDGPHRRAASKHERAAQQDAGTHDKTGTHGGPHSFSSSRICFS